MNSVKYVRLLNYPNACKVIDFVNKAFLLDGRTEKNFAYITTGGVGMQIEGKDLPKIEEFIQSLDKDIRYEINDEKPHITNSSILKTLKEQGII